MYIAIYNRYSPFPVSFYLKYLSSTSAQPSDRLPERQSIQVFLLESVLIGAQQGVQTVTVWISGNSAITTKWPCRAGAWDPSEVAAPMFSYNLKASIKAFAKSDEAIRITLVSARERPMRLTLPYHPIHWSMIAHCIYFGIRNYRNVCIWQRPYFQIIGCNRRFDSL